MGKKIVLLVMGVVVWGMGSEKVWGYEISPFVVYTGSGDQSWPVVDGDVVVWVDAAFGNGPSGPIHYKNLSTGQDHVITTSQTSTWWGYRPAIDGDTIVWTDLRNYITRV